MLPLVFIVILAVVVLLTVLIGKNRETEDACKRAYSTAQKLKDRMETDNYFANPERDDLRTGFDQTAELFEGRIIVTDSTLKIVYDSLNIETGRTAVSEEIIRALSGNENLYKYKNEYYEIIMPVKESENVIGVFVMRISLKTFANMIDDVLAVLVLLGIMAALLVVAFSIFFSGRVTKPLRKMCSSIEIASKNNSYTDVPKKGYRETIELAEAFNHMFSSMQKLDESRSRFVSDVSHELKTPMTSIKLLADSLLSDEGIPEEIYRDFLTDISSEIDRENKIINDLLELVKEEQGNTELHIARVNINEMVEKVVKRMVPIAQKAGIKLIFDSYRSIFADVDEIKLSYALLNLVENAVKYNRENGWVRVTTDCDHRFFTITVADSGIGIPAKDQDRIFERFYRVDKARSRESGGTGLGLSIVRNVIFAHKGSIKLTSIIDDGSSFHIRIPIVYSGNAGNAGGEAR